MTPEWYLKRLASMSRQEVVGRSRDAAIRRLWRHRPPAMPEPIIGDQTLVVPENLVSSVKPEAQAAVVAQADRILDGRVSMFGRVRTDVTADVDYFLDFVNGTTAPSSAYSLTIDHRDEESVGNIKFVWELARHQHLSVLASAFALTDDDRYAQRIRDELGNYWRANPFLRGIHWTSGIEIGIRLISWTWIRRLLDGWPGAADLFENNDLFVEQLGRHQQWLAAFESHGSSANNHLIAEASGQFVASCAFPLFAQSQGWRERAAKILSREIELQTFSDGLNKELASEYHGFVLELTTVAWLEAVLVDHELASQILEPISRSFRALRSVVDCQGKPHRQGDADDAHGWLVDPADYDHWASLLRTGELIANTAPLDHSRSSVVPDIRTELIAQCIAGRFQPRNRNEKDRALQSHFPDAGLTILRDLPPSQRKPASLKAGSRPNSDSGPELWCIFDHGPHGFLSTTAHAHADALAVEIRCDGIEIVADPGTYCYHGETEWRDYFRSTRAHATVGLADQDQSEIAGPFLWTKKANTSLRSYSGLDQGESAMVEALHDGYSALGFTHQRSVRLDRPSRTIAIVDDLIPVPVDESDQTQGQSERLLVPVTMTYPLGPTVSANLTGDPTSAELRWCVEGSNEIAGQATATLDPAFSWTIVIGERTPPLGWYSASFGLKQPSPVLVGTATLPATGNQYKTVFHFEEAIHYEETQFEETLNTQSELEVKKP